jgi:hypothetical protein
VPSGTSGAALRATLRSVLATDAEMQVVVVDRDPSTATTAETVARMADARLLYACAPGATVRLARERGVRIATADVVAFVVPDTIVHEGWLEALVAPFARPRVGCVVGRLPERDAERSEEALRARPAAEVIDLLWDGDRPPAVSFAIRRPGPTGVNADTVAYAPHALAWPQVHRQPTGLVVA